MTALIAARLDANRHTYTPVGFRLVDDITGKGPLGDVSCALFAQDGVNQWRRADVQPARSVSGLFIFPDLGRSAVVAGASLRRYRAAIEAQYYRPFDSAASDLFVFDAFPFNDDNPPAQVEAAPRTVVLVPAPNYPFESHLRVLRGLVQDTARNAVAGAEVFLGNTERTVSDSKGAFALALRLSPRKGQIKIDAVDSSKTHHGEIAVALPDDLGKSNLIIIA